MTITAPQAISGVSPQAETMLRTEYPSVASRPTGRFLGSLYESIPLKLNGVKLSHLLFTLPTAPIGLLWYFGLKVFGSKYMLTNRSVQQWASLGNRLITQVPLTDVDQVVVEQTAGQQFFKASDIHLLNASGEILLTLPGIVRAEIFRETILDARDARVNIEASLATIQAR